MLTRGLACCLVLGLEVTPDNERMAIEKMKTIDMAPFYRNDPDDPAAVATVVQRRNPMKYRAYPDTGEGNIISLEVKWIVRVFIYFLVVLHL
jgi:hypothetical protein